MQGPDIRTQIEPLKRQGRFREARAVVLDGLAQIKAERGESNRSYANALRDLADIDRALANLAAARDATEAALHIREKLNDVDLVTLVENRWQLGSMEMDLGRQDVARPLLEKALADVTLTPMAYTVLHAQILECYATIAAWEGRFAQAEASLAEARRYIDAGGDFSNQLEFESLAARIYRDMGMLGLAEQYLRRTITKLHSPPPGLAADPGELDMLVSMVEWGLARVLVREGRCEEAAELAANALPKVLAFPPAMRWAALGPHLALIEAETARGRPQAALGHAEAALPLVKSPLSEAEVRYAMASAQGALGRHEEASKNIARAVEIVSGSSVPDVPRILRYLEVQAMLAWSAGDLDSATSHFQKLQATFERFVLQSLAGLPEVRQRAVLTAYSQGLSAIVSFHFATKHRLPESIGLAVDTVLQRKGRQLETAVGITALGRMGTSETAVRTVGALNLVNAQIAAERIDAALTSGGPDTPREVELLARRAELERRLREVLPPFEVQREQANAATVASALPGDTVLVEYVHYKVVDPASGAGPAAPAEHHFGAFIIMPDGVLASVDLGESSHIESLTLAWVQAMTARERKQTKVLGRQLDAAILEPVLGLAGRRKHILIAGDGATAGIPFAALCGPDGRYRLEDDLVISYLTTGSELMRRLDTRPAETGPVVMGSPDFDSEPADLVFQRLLEILGGVKGHAITQPGVGSTAKATSGDTSRTPEQDLSLADEIMRSAAEQVRSGIGSFPELPGAALEGEAVAKALGVTAILGKGASKLKFKLETTSPPRILHVATHAYVLEGETDSAKLHEHELPLLLDDSALPVGRSGAMDPMLRSGIALAGVNLLRHVREGLMTALELAVTDLSRTELVVLSACKTGRGQAVPGEGVIGLRRALELSGAHSSLTTLWSIADQPTKRFMELFYEQLLQPDRDRAEALAQTQKTMLAEQTTEAPAHWAPFVLSGRTKVVARPIGL